MIKHKAIFVSLILITCVFSNTLFLSTSLAEDTEATIAALESIGWPTEGYIARVEKIAEYREQLLDFGEYEDRINACAEIMYSIKMCDGFKDPDVFDKWQESILSNFISLDEIIEFYQTGEVKDTWNWRPIYFKNEKGESTSELAIIYVYNSENEYFKVDDIEWVISWWDSIGSKDFLKTIVSNSVRVLLQSQASSNENVQVFKYGYSIIYWNYSGDSLSSFKTGLMMGLGVEQFGVRGEALKGEQKSDLVAVFKARFVLECCQHLFSDIDNKNISAFDKKKLESLIRKYQNEIERYTKNYWTDKGKLIESLETEYTKVKYSSLIHPFGADSWEEIDAAMNND